MESNRQKHSRALHSLTEAVSCTYRAVLVLQIQLEVMTSEPQHNTSSSAPRRFLRTFSGSAAQLERILPNAGLLPFLLLGQFYGSFQASEPFCPQTKTRTTRSFYVTALIVSINPSRLFAVGLQTCCFSQSAQGQQKFY